MLVLDPNITNSWNRQITTRFFLYPALNLQRTLSHLNEQSRELLLILMIYFRLYFWFLRLSVTPPSHSCVSGQWGGAAGAEKKGREAAGSRLWTPWTREEMINNNNINITNITSQLRPDRCSSSHVILWVQTDRTCFFFYPLFFTSCWEVSLCCFFFFSGGVAAGVCFQPDCIRIKPAEFLVSHQQGHTEREEEAVEEIMEILDSSEPFLHWDRNLSELSEAGEIDCALYTNVSYRSGMCGWLIRAWWLTLEPIRGI